VTDDAPDGLAASVLTRRLAAEVERAEWALRRVERSIAPLIAEDRAGLASHAVQDIDLVLQSLADIARCLDGLSGQLSPLAVLDGQALLAPLRLDDIAKRLAGQLLVALHPDERIALF